MQFIKPDININFIGKRRIAYVISLTLILATLGAIMVKGGPRYGIDFAGGTLIQVRFDGPAAVADIKTGLAQRGIGSPSVQSFGEADTHEFLIRIDSDPTAEADTTANLEAALQAATGQTAEIRRTEMVGPQVGKDLREKALLAMFWALLFISVYISGRFEMKWLQSCLLAVCLAGSVYLLSAFAVGIPFLMLAALVVTLVLFWFLSLKYAMGAIVALLHDVIITMGVFVVFDKEFTLPIIAALLTIIGYSLNDTIIVFDRIRENLRKYHRQPLDAVINRSINETLSRTILTSGTTLIVLLSLFVLGGGIIHDFAFALTIGVLVGTYSSVYVASPILLAWHARTGRKYASK